MFGALLEDVGQAGEGSPGRLVDRVAERLSAPLAAGPPTGPGPTASGPTRRPLPSGSTNSRPRPPPSAAPSSRKQLHEKGDRCKPRISDEELGCWGRPGIASSTAALNSIRRTSTPGRRRRADRDHPQVQCGGYPGRPYATARARRAAGWNAPSRGTCRSCTRAPSTARRGAGGSRANQFRSPAVRRGSRDPAPHDASDQPRRR